MYVKSGKKINNDQVFTDANGTQYPPAAWQARLTELGISQVDDPIRPDDRFFTVTENANGTYSATPRNRDAVNADLWARIKLERDRRSDQCGYKVGAKWYHSDQRSRSQQLGLVLLGSSIPSGLQWKTMDGSFITMTQTLAQQILAAAAASDQAIFAAAEAHKTAVEASSTPETYNIYSGWPTGFGE